MPWDEIKARQFPAFDKKLDGISRQTMEDHYKLYEGYVKKVNECRRILNEFDYGEIEGNQVYSPLRAVSIDYTFALLGFKNHDLYFGHLGGDGGEPDGRFAELIDSEFNGVAKWQDAVRKAASAARGWVMVGYDLNDGSLFNYITCGRSTTWSRCWRSTSTSTPTPATSARRRMAASSMSRRSSATSTGTTSTAS
jgi:Fe-Mn family superoxide dismutase